MTKATGIRIIGATAILGFSAFAIADTAAGTAAFRKGDVATAYREWQAAADADLMTVAIVASCTLYSLASLLLVTPPAVSLRQFRPSGLGRTSLG